MNEPMDVAKYIEDNFKKAEVFIEKSGLIKIKIGKVKLYGEWKDK